MTMSTQTDLQKLQALLLGRHQVDLDTLRERLEDPQRRAEDIAAVLVEALQKTPEPEKLTRVISEPATEAIRISIRRDSERVAGILYPAVLPAIRKSIEQAMQGFLESIDLLLKQQFSLASLKWRIEALRTGVPFHEIMLRHLLKYQVEQVFLIHRRSGLLIEHVSLSGEMARDQDAVSAMLSAIESFVKESFSAEQDNRLSRVTVGDRIVYLEHGPSALLASVVRGVATPAYRKKIKEINEDIHAGYSRQLEQFSGSTAEIPGLRNRLSQALGREFQFQERKEKHANAKKIKMLAAAGGLLVLLLAGYLGWHHVQKSRLEKLLTTMAERPGIMTSQVVPDGEGGWVIHGLRDPDAPAPSDLAAKFNLEDKVAFRFEPFLSLAPDIIERRARRILNIPASVRSEVTDKVLRLNGEAPLDWLLSLSSAAKKLPAGLNRIDTTDVQINPAELQRLLSTRPGGLENLSLKKMPSGAIELLLPPSVSKKEYASLKRLEAMLAPKLKITTVQQ